jgi:hypothetical protein
MSMEERLRQHSNHLSRRNMNSPVPQPVPVSTNTLECIFRKSTILGIPTMQAPMHAPLAQNSPQAAFPHPMQHMRTPPQLGSDASRSPAVSNGPPPGFAYNSPNAFMMPQPVPPPQQAPAPVPAPVPVVSPWSVSTKLHVQV